MAILPWVNLPQNRTPDQLGSIGDTLVEASRNKQAQEQKAADLLLRQRTADREDRLTGAQMANYASEAEARRSEAEMRKAQQKRIDEEEKRKQGLDVATAIPTIRAMLTPGSPTYDPQSAMSLARAHGIDLAATQPAAPVQPQIGPTSVEEGPRETPEIAQQAGLERAVRNVPGDAAPQAGAAEDKKQIQAAETERQRFAEANDPEAVQRNKLLGQQYADQVSKFRTAQPTYSGTSPIGPVNIDPNAALESQRFALEENKRKMAPLMNIPGMEKYAPGIQAAIASGAKPEQVNALVSKAIEDSRKDQEKADYSLTADDQRRHQKAMEAAAFANAGANRLRAGSQDSGREDTAAARAQALLERKLNDVDRMVDWKGLTAMDNNLRSTLVNASDPNALNHRDAQIQLAKYFRGNVPTEGEMKHLYTNLGGGSDKFNQWLAAFESGDASEEQMRQLRHSAETAQEELARRKERAAQAIKTSLGPGSGLEMMGPQVNAALKARGQYVGIDMPAVYPEGDGDPAKGGAVLLGSRNKPTVGERLTGAAKKQPAGNPLTRAAGGKLQQASVDDLLKQAGF